MKKILAVATALVLAISSLCVFAVADDTYEFSFENVSVTGRWSSSTTYPANSDGSLTVTYASQYSEIWFEVPSAVEGTITSVTVNVTSGTASDLCIKIYDENNTAVVTKYNSNTYTLSDDEVTILSSASTVKIAIMYQGTSGETYTFSGVTVTTKDTSSSSGSTATETVEIDGVTYSVVYENALSDLTGWSTILTVTDEVYGYLTTDGAIIEVDFSQGSWLWAALWVQETTNYDQEQVGGEWNQSFSTPFYITVSDTTLTSSSCFISGGSQIILNMGDGVVASNVRILVPATTDPSTTTPTSSSRNQGVIYINEEYHGIFVTRTIGTTTRKYLVNVPHTVDSTGYCTVCCMYIGSDEEAGTTTIDGVEYEAAYSSDIKLASGSWSAADLGDTSILDALATEGALLVVTRDSEQNIVFSNEETIYEKFVLVNSWYSGDTVQLGTAGHTSADEPDTGIIDCISDDGTTAVYDGNTIYDTWVSNGLNAGGTVLFISNTSSTDYSIANITVYVPAGTVTAEDVDVDEPAEEGETETEDDEAEDLTVDDDTTETPAETNPTTGAVLALVPMAIAGFAVVSSKRR